MENQSLLVGKREAASLLGVSPRTVDNLVARGELRPRRIGRRILFERRALEGFSRRDHATQDSRPDRSLGSRPTSN